MLCLAHIKVVLKFCGKDLPNLNRELIEASSSPRNFSSLWLSRHFANGSTFREAACNLEFDLSFDEKPVMKTCRPSQLSETYFR